MTRWQLAVLTVLALALVACFIQAFRVSRAVAQCELSGKTRHTCDLMVTAGELP